MINSVDGHPQIVEIIQVFILSTRKFPKKRQYFTVLFDDF